MKFALPATIIEAIIFKSPVYDRTPATASAKNPPPKEYKNSTT